MTVEEKLQELALPPNVGPEREAAILQAVLDGRATMEWAKVTSSHQGHVAEFNVFADALKIEGVRVNVSAETEQKIADSMGCLLLTPKIADLLWEQAVVRIEPRPRSITATTKAMVEHSFAIDKQLEALEGSSPGLIQTVGKHWVIDEALASKPGRAMNYGWHFAGSSYQGISGEVTASLLKDPKTRQYARLIQGRGTAHDMHHSDYSQVCVLVASQCTVDGVERTLEEVLQDSELAPLASHTGKMTILRQPGVELTVVGATIFGEVPKS
jgi:hypothetical protein